MTQRLLNGELKRAFTFKLVTFSDLERKSGCDSFLLSVDNESLGSREVYVQVIFIRDIRRRADLPPQKDSASK